MATWSGLSSDAALRSKVASSKFHLRRRGSPDQLRKLAPVLVVADAAALGREVVLVPPLQLGLAAETAACRPPGCRSGSRSPRPGRAALRPQRGDDAGGPRSPVEPRHDRLVDRRARPGRRPRRRRAPPARRCARSRRSRKRVRPVAAKVRHDDAVAGARTAAERPRRSCGCRTASRAAGEPRDRRRDRRRRSPRSGGRRRSAAPGRRRWRRADACGEVSTVMRRSRPPPRSRRTPRHRGSRRSRPGAARS